jgi:hypothetical protein
MDATKTVTKTERIRLSDGRLGRQTREQQPDGSWVLTEVVITSLADGTRCQHVYGPTRYLDAYVYRFADLGNVEWEIAD